MSTTEKVQPPHTGPYAEHMGLDPIIHEAARLMILVILDTVGKVEFKDLERATQLRPGNLSAQAAKLEEAGYITVRKFFKKKFPATEFQITSTGKKALKAYWQRLNILQRGAQSLEEVKQQADGEHLLGKQNL